MSAAYPPQMADQTSCGVNGTVPDSFDWSSDTTKMASQGCIGGNTALDPVSTAPSFTFCLSLALTMTMSLQTASPLIVTAAQPLLILTISLT
jgi:hypothetical protein